MAAYRVNHDYKSSAAGPFEAGTVIDLDAATAEWLERDSPGCVSLVDPVLEEDKPKPAKKVPRGA